MTRHLFSPLCLLALVGACATETVYETPVDVAAITTLETQTEDDFETVDSSAGALRVEELADFTYPWAMEALPDGRLLVTEKVGNLRIFENGEVSAPLEGVPQVAYRGQGGLLDVAVDPDFATNRLIYLYTVDAAPEQPANPAVDADPRLGPYVDESDTVLKGGAVVRARLEGERLEEVETIWRQSEGVVGLGHYGGRLAFADDGTLVITSGERQKFAPAQDPQSNLGKLVRINTDGTIPADNPYASAPAPRNAIWSSGHRNPLGLAARPETGELWLHEMGPLYGDEFQRVERGGNYGWPIVSNGEHYDRVEIPHHETQPDRFNRPEFYWRPAISPSGLAFYNGDMFADWRGDAFIGGLSAQALIRVDFDGDKIAGDERIALNTRVRDVMEGPDGAIYVLTDYEDGALLRLSPVPDTN